MLDRFFWIFIRRFFLKKKYNGFSAGRYTYADKRCLFAEYVKLHGNARLGNVRIGRFSYIGTGCRISNTDIGSFCSIAPNVIMGVGTHPLNFLSTSPLFYSSKGQLELSLADLHLEENKRITIGNDVWIGYGAFLKDGITVGDGAVIGAGAVIVKDVPAYAIVGGVPAKVIRMRFSEEQIGYIKNLNWYDWNLNKLKEQLPLFTKSLGEENDSW